ncbi:MAG: tetratricopeptide repeat protein, partial [Planctomycetota bacterium]
METAQNREKSPLEPLFKGLGVLVLVLVAGYFVWTWKIRSPSPAVQAEVLFDQGIKACDEGRYTEGIDALRKTAELAHRGQMGVQNKAEIGVLQELEAGASLHLGGYLLQGIQARYKDARAEAGQSGAAFAIPRAEFTEAENAINRAIELKPNAQTFYLLGVLYRDSGRLLQAIDTFEKALKSDEYYGTKAAGNEARARIHNDLGEAYFRVQQNDRALDHYGKAVELDPALADAQFNLGLFYNALSDQPGEAGLREKAEEHLRQFLVLTRNKPNEESDRAVAK